MAEAWPDALVLDINLPDDTGWEVLRKLGPESRSRLHVVVISAAPISRSASPSSGRRIRSSSRSRSRPWSALLKTGLSLPTEASMNDVLYVALSLAIFGGLVAAILGFERV